MNLMEKDKLFCIDSQANYMEKDKLFYFDSSRLSHAYITEADFADTLASAVVCGVRDGKRPCMKCTHCDKASRHIHPDIIYIDRLDSKLIISVDQIREIKQDVYIVPNEAEQKAYVVKNADSMNINAQNALLQILEEPPAHAVFILSTSNPAALLPTVRSRCVEIKLIPMEETAEDTAENSGNDSDDTEELNDLADMFISALTKDNVKLMECMFRIDKLDRLAFNSFLTLTHEKIIISLRENLNDDKQEIRNALIKAEAVLTKAGEMLNLNVSSGHIAGYICASMI